MCGKTDGTASFFRISLDLILRLAIRLGLVTKSLSIKCFEQSLELGVTFLTEKSFLFIIFTHFLHISGSFGKWNKCEPFMDVVEHPHALHITIITKITIQITRYTVQAMLF